MCSMLLARVTAIGAIAVPTAWRCASLLLGVTFALLFLRWQIVDQAPPMWDQAMYLNNAWTEWHAAVQAGVSS